MKREQQAQYSTMLFQPLGKIKGPDSGSPLLKHPCLPQSIPELAVQYKALGTQTGKRLRLLLRVLTARAGTPAACLSHTSPTFF